MTLLVSKRGFPRFDIYIRQAETGTMRDRERKRQRQIDKQMYIYTKDRKKI